MAGGVPPGDAVRAAVTRRALLVGALAVAAPACRRRDGARLRIAVVPKGTSHQYWKGVEAGVRRAAAAAAGSWAARGKRLELVWKGPLREDDREQQVQVVEGFVAQAFDGLVLAPLDAHALARPVEEARRLGIPTVVIDSALASADPIATIATDNAAAGALAADELAKRLAGRGQAILLRYQQGSASTEAREAGFLSRLQAHPGVKLLSADQHAGGSRDTAKRAAENLLNRFGGQVDAFFAPSEPVTMGVLLALQDAGRAGAVTLVGFDPTPALVAAMRSGQVHGLMAQDPERMGARGVETLLAHLAGTAVARDEATDSVLVTRETLDTPRVRALLGPTSQGRQG